MSWIDAESIDSEQHTLPCGEVDLGIRRVCFDRIHRVTSLYIIPVRVSRLNARYPVSQERSQRDKRVQPLRPFRREIKAKPPYRHGVIIRYVNLNVSRSFGGEIRRPRKPRESPVSSCPSVCDTPVTSLRHRTLTNPRHPPTERRPLNASIALSGNFLPPQFVADVHLFTK